MMRFELDIYRERMPVLNIDRWFFDDKAKGIVHEEFVAGIPELIKFLCENARATKVHAIIDTQRFEGAFELKFSHEENGGVVYSLHHLNGWLCPVFWQYFSKPPKSLWVSVKEI